MNERQKGRVEGERSEPRARNGEAMKPEARDPAERGAGRWMKRVVALCLLFCAVFSVAAYVAKWFGVESVDVLTVVVGLFGGELLMTCVLKLIGDKPARESEAKPPGKDDGNG